MTFWYFYKYTKNCQDSNSSSDDNKNNNIRFNNIENNFINAYLIWNKMFLLYLTKVKSNELKIF